MTTDYKVTDTELVAVADAIRSKGETQALLEWPNGYISAINAIPTPIDIVSWADGTDEQIVAMLQAAHNGDIDLQTDGGWAVGDTRTIAITSFTSGDNISVPAQSIDIVISQFGDYNSCGCVMQFDFKQSLSNELRMNSTQTTSGGYEGSLMKASTIPALVNALPSWLKTNLVEFSCAAGGGTVTGNKLALRSEMEIYGSVTQGTAIEGSQIEYYVDKPKPTKTLGRGGSNSAWTCRTVSTYSGFFVSVGLYGNAAYGAADGRYGLSPFGCL